jgi:homoserine dehydrogenase
MTAMREVRGRAAGAGRTIRVGLLGCGTVGQAVVRLLLQHEDDVTLRAGIRLEVARVAVRDLDKARDVPLEPGRFTDDPEQVVKDPDVDVVCEVMGGMEPARTLMLAALDAGKPVVTANKEVLATVGRQLLDRAEETGVDLAFEASAGGGIPIVRPLKESLAGERIHRLVGILNGTTNYILTRMAEDGLAFDEALAEAQVLGYAEADPAADVEGHDAAAKCAILASIAFNTRVAGRDVFREGIERVGPEDIRNAELLGYVIKPVAIAELEDEDVTVRVHPAMIPAAHPLAAVREAFNAVFVQGQEVGELMLYGRGAGGGPTATAVVGDLVRVARNLVLGGRGVGCTCYLDRRIRPVEDMKGACYLVLDVEDRPGVLAQIAGVFGDNDVSIKSVWQEGTGEEAHLILITHRAREGALQSTVAEVQRLDPVRAVRSVLRVEESE